jgi:hypothetical protein
MQRMDALQLAQEFIARDRSHPDAAVMATLIQTLQDEGSFELGRLYDLDLERFELALRILDDWRLQRYYLGHASAVGASPGWSQ